MLIPQHKLSRRERQIMDILYRKGRATAAEIQAELPEAPSYSAVRAMLRVLEEKKHIRMKKKTCAMYLFRRCRATRRAAQRLRM